MSTPQQQKDDDKPQENVFDRVRREVREKQEEEVERRRQFDEMTRRQREGQL